MTSKIRIIVLGCFFACIAQGTYASSSFSSAIHSCETYNQEVASKSISTTIKHIPVIGDKLQAMRKYIIVMKVWGSRCAVSSVNSSSKTTVDTSYFTLAHTDVLDAYSGSQRKDIENSTKIYESIFIKTVDDLIAAKLLTPEDKELMKGKVTLQYVANCTEFDGKISLKQWYDGNKKWVKNELLGFNINVNVCFEPWFANNVTSSVSQIMAHELGHFFYYFHDKTYKNFEALCWSDATTTTCGRKSFVSDYAMTSGEEDYAESFAFWFLHTFPTSKNDSLLKKKLYFDTILKNIQ